MNRLLAAIRPQVATVIGFFRATSIEVETAVGSPTGWWISIGKAVSEITSTRAAVEFCDDAFSGLAISGVQEEFHIVTLSTKHLPINTHLITRGTLDASLVHPREVFRPAIRDSASAVILVHNHPSGDATPSREDHQVTDRMTEVGTLLGITVLDHIVVASEGSVSIRELA